MDDKLSTFGAIFIVFVVLAVIIVIAVFGFTVIAIFIKNGGWALILAIIVIAILANGEYGSRG